MKVMKLQENTKGYYFLNIPKAIVETKGWKKGMKFGLSDTGKGLVIEPME